MYDSNDRSVRSRSKVKSLSRPAARQSARGDRATRPPPGRHQAATRPSPAEAGPAPAEARRAVRQRCLLQCSAPGRPLLQQCRRSLIGDTTCIVARRHGFTLCKAQPPIFQFGSMSAALPYSDTASAASHIAGTASNLSGTAAGLRLRWGIACCSHHPPRRCCCLPSPPAPPPRSRRGPGR